MRGRPSGHLKVVEEVDAAEDRREGVDSCGPIFLFLTMIGADAELEVFFVLFGITTSGTLSFPLPLSVRRDFTEPLKLTLSSSSLSKESSSSVSSLFLFFPLPLPLPP